MEPAKLQFSAHEMMLVSNAEWILTKNEILNRVGLLMGELNRVQKSIIKELPVSLPPEILATTAKISRGENYKGLPYLVLDYPRLFTRNNIFATRSLFWWGKTLSTTLHLSGQWQQFFAERILANNQYLAQNGFVIATGEDEWVHDATGVGYTPAEQLSEAELQDMLAMRPFFKLALFTTVDELNNGVEIWKEQFEKIMRLLG